MKWVLPHYIFTDGTRPEQELNWKEEHWEFDDGTVPPQVVPGLDEVPGHWELSDGQKIDPLQMNPLELANAFHEWA